MNEVLRDVIFATKVVAHFNKPMWELVASLEANSDTLGLKDKMAAKIGVGSTLFEALGEQSPRLADALHDFVYQISNAHQSVIAKDIAREELIRLVLDL